MTLNYINTLNTVLGELNLKAKVVSQKIEGPYLLFDLSLDSGGKFSQIEKYSTEIALALRSVAEPLIYPIIHKGIIRMEFLIDSPELIHFENVVISCNDKVAEYNLPLILGRMRNGNPLVADLSKMPHLLVGGATGSGKSMMLHAMIHSLDLKRNVKLILIDPKRVEFSVYSKWRNMLYSPIIYNILDAENILKKLINEMERRFSILEKSGCRDISLYNGKMPYIVIIIDEIADLMFHSKKNFQNLLCKLAQKSRACGIHIIAATQRPSVDVITGLIKSNFPARISCKVSSGIDSRTILDKNGAEKLLGKGDAIIDCDEYDFIRFQGAYLEFKPEIKISTKTNWWSKLWSG